MKYKCEKCGKDAPTILCFKCFDEEILSLPNVQENYVLKRQSNGSFTPIAYYVGVGLKKDYDREQKES